MLVLDTLKLSAGTATLAPLQMAAGVPLTTPLAGAVAYDGKALYFTPDTAGGRGVSEVSLIAVLTTSSPLASAIGNQRIFNTPTTGALTLASDTTYKFEALFTITAGTGLASNSFSFGGTATVTSVGYVARCLDVTAAGMTGTAISSYWVSMAGGALDAPNTNPLSVIEIRGVMRINVGGTVIPQIAFSGAPGGTCQANVNSFIKFSAVGNSTVNAVGAWA